MNSTTTTVGNYATPTDSASCGGIVMILSTEGFSNPASAGNSIVGLHPQSTPLSLTEIDGGGSLTSNFYIGSSHAGGGGDSSKELPPSSATQTVLTPHDPNSSITKAEVSKTADTPRDTPRWAHGTSRQLQTARGGFSSGGTPLGPQQSPQLNPSSASTRSLFAPNLSIVSDASSSFMQRPAPTHWTLTPPMSGRSPTTTGRSPGASWGANNSIPFGASATHLSPPTQSSCCFSPATFQQQPFSSSNNNYGSSQTSSSSSGKFMGRRWSGPSTTSDPLNCSSIFTSTLPPPPPPPLLPPQPLFQGEQPPLVLHGGVGPTVPAAQSGSASEHSGGGNYRAPPILVNIETRCTAEKSSPVGYQIQPKPEHAIVGAGGDGVMVALLGGTGGVDNPNRSRTSPTMNQL